MSYFWKMSQCNMTFDLKINVGHSDLYLMVHQFLSFIFCSEKHFSFIGKAWFRRVTLSCDSFYILCCYRNLIFCLFLGVYACIVIQLFYLFVFFCCFFYYCLNSIIILMNLCIVYFSKISLANKTCPAFKGQPAQLYTVTILSFRTDMPGHTVQTQIKLFHPIRVYTSCHFGCIIWTHYPVVEPHISNFRVITTNLLGVRMFRKFMVLHWRVWCSSVYYKLLKLNHFKTGWKFTYVSHNIKTKTEFGNCWYKRKIIWYMYFCKY